MSYFVDYKEASNIEEFYGKKTPKFSFLFITIITILFILVIIWSVFSTKESIVKSQGLIASNQKVNLMNYVSGTIEQIHYNEGDRVEKGDVIMTIDSSSIDYQISQIVEKANYYQLKIDSIKTFIDFINGMNIDDEKTLINPFDEANTLTLKEYNDCQYIIDYINTQIENNKNVEESDENYFGQDDLEQRLNSFIFPLFIFIIQFISIFSS